MDILAPLNRAIMALSETGLTGILYQAWIVAVYLVVAAFCLVYRRHYGYGWFRSLLIPLVVLLSLNIFLLLIGWARSGFTLFGTKNIELGYPFVPLMVIGAARLMKDDWRRMLDFMTPGLSLTLTMVKISCCFVGCCFSFPVEHGLWNPIFETELFPLQIVEGILALVLCVVCVLIAKKQDYRVTGRIYPIFLILFGSIRFFLDILRVNPKRFWFVSDLAIAALVMVIIGVVWLIVDKKKRPKRRQAR